MEIDSHNTLHIKNEKIQIALRITIISIIIISLLYFNNASLYVETSYSLKIIDIFLSIIALNFLYYFLILKFPFFLHKQRIIYISIMDVIASAYVMYIVGSYSAYYPVLFLWYNIGYSMRYGNNVGFSVYITTIISWSLLMIYSDYWMNNLSLAIGWLIAFIIIPIYHFYLLKKLKDTLSQLHQNLNFSEYRSYHDELTKLPNRLSFEEELKNSILKSKKFALFFIDLDEFKKVNDSFGHDIGDKVLIHTAKRIMSLNNFAARLGGDEFVSIVEFEDEQYIQEYAKKLTQLLASKCDNEKVKISTSIGIAIYPKDTNNIHELKRKSDIAMYEAKKRGKNTFCFYSHKL